jgi:hexosaminidase
MKHLPISIEDQPEFSYRAIMVDSSRHYLPLKQIYESIDALMYNKMNILHWHIVDEDSFPLKLDSHPEIAEYAAFSP